MKPAKTQIIQFPYSRRLARGWPLRASVSPNGSPWAPYPKKDDLHIPVSALTTAVRMSNDLAMAFGGVRALFHGHEGIVSFGGSRSLGEFGPHAPFYQLVQETAHVLGHHGWHFMCGAKDSGTNKAVLTGSKDSHAKVLGVRVHGQDGQPSADLDMTMTFDHPHTRKLAEDFFADAFIFAPGGIGTMDKLFEVMTLQQTGISPERPIICLGKSFFQKGLEAIWRNFGGSAATISSRDGERVRITDDPNEVARLLFAYREKQLVKHARGMLRRSHWDEKYRDLPGSAAREMAKGFHALRNIGPSVSIFGSARTKPDTGAYKMVLALSKLIGDKIGSFNQERFGAPHFLLPGRRRSPVRHRYSGIVTGGGPGTMRAANEGAKEAGIPSIGLGIRLPFEQTANGFADPELDFIFKYFFTRKYFFHYHTKVFVLASLGGLGTLDEFFEMARAIEQGDPFRAHGIYAYGEEFWRSTIGELMSVIAEFGFDQASVMDPLRQRIPVDQLIHYSDDPEEIATHVDQDLRRGLT